VLASKYGMSQAQARQAQARQAQARQAQARQAEARVAALAEAEGLEPGQALRQARDSLSGT
jgi:hypothetical protein